MFAVVLALCVCAADVTDLTIVGAEQTYTVTAAYGADAFTVTFAAAEGWSGETVSVCFSVRGATELAVDQAWQASAAAAGACTVYGYQKSVYKNPTEVTAELVEADGAYTLSIGYAQFGLTYESARGCFAFYPTVTAGDVPYTYSDPFVLEKYGETWFALGAENQISYNSSYADRTVENWTRPSFVNQERMYAGVVKEGTVEGAIIAIAIAEEKGAMGIDLHLDYLHDSGLLTEENLRRIFQSTTLPILAINYNSGLAHQLRCDELLLAAQAGCSAIDLPAFMFWESGSENTHTDENIAYWQALGYDLSFISCEPSETVLDLATVEAQKEYIRQVKALGTEVLMSCHVKTVFTAEQAVEYIRFHAARGVDIVKVVGYGYTKADVAACVEACKTLREDAEMTAKFSYHLSGGVGAYITRVICPVFYGSYIAFCYPELTAGQDANQLDLSMAIATLAAAEGADKDIPIADAIARVKAVSDHAQLAELVRKYENCHVIGKAYGKTTDYSKRWSIDGDTYGILLREAGSTGSYNMRGYAYNGEKTQSKNIYISATVTGDLKPYASASRAPKAGVYIGTEEKMLALVYNMSAKTVDLVYNSQHAFTYDKDITGDVLVSAGLITPQSFAVEVADGESLSLGMHLKADMLDLYAGTDRLLKIASVPVTEELLSGMQKNADGTYNAGVVLEAYMGSPSKELESTITFTDVSYKIEGDVNGDGLLDAVDALSVIRALLDGRYVAEMDMNGDGKLMLWDALSLLKKIV